MKKSELINRINQSGIKNANIIADFVSKFMTDEQLLFMMAKAKAVVENCMDTTVFANIQIVDTTPSIVTSPGSWELGNAVANHMNNYVAELGTSGSNGDLVDDAGNIMSAVIGSYDNNNFLPWGFAKTQKEIHALKDATETAILVQKSSFADSYIEFMKLAEKYQNNMNSQSNFYKNWGTPIYDSLVRALVYGLPINFILQDNGISCKLIATLVSDGRENASQLKLKETLTLIDTARSFFSDSTILGLGMGNDESYFKKTFLQLGVRENKIFTCGSDTTAARAALFQIVKQSKLESQL